MKLLKDLSGYKLSELKKTQVQCADGETIGRLIDAAFKYTDQKLNLTKFVVGGSKIEELLERIRLKPDIDPVFGMDVIHSISPSRVKLTVPRDELKSTHINQDALENDEITLSKLGKMKILDSDKKEIGNIIDLKFDGGEFTFLIGDGPIIEWAESAGLLTDIDYLLSPTSIKTIENNQIKLKMRKDELQSTFMKHVADYQSKQKTKKDLQEIKARGSFYFPSVQ